MRAPRLTSADNTSASNGEMPECRAAVEQLVWSQIHGHAHLMIDGKPHREGGDGL